MTATRCPKCARIHSGPRSAPDLVGAITRVSHQMLALEDDKARILLRLQLRILTAELDGLCQSCQWSRAAQEHADAGATRPPPTPEQIEEERLGGPVHVCTVTPIRRDLGVRFRGRGTVYEQSSGEPLHPTCRADAPEGER